MDLKGRLPLLGLAISTANLLLLSVWSELLFTNKQSHYYMLSLPAAQDYLAAVANVIVLGLVFYWIIVSMERSGIRRLLPAARIAFVLVLLIPLNVIRLAFPYVGIGELSVYLHRYGLVIPALILGGMVGVLVLRYRRIVFVVARTLVLILLPFAAMTTVQALVKAVRAHDSVSFGPARFNHTPGLYDGKTRVVWIIFDELEESVVYSNRPAGLELPQFDSLRMEGVQVTRAIAPSAETLVSVPSLLSGMRLTRADPLGPSDLQVAMQGSDRPVRFSTLPTIFSRAKQAGIQTTAIGWYHPYSRLFPGVLDRCSWRPVYQTVIGQVEKADKNLFGAMIDQMAAISPLNRRRLAIDAYRRILKDARDAVATGSGLIFLHFPIPHVPAIYNRSRGELTTLVPSNIEGYVDNVALADRTLAELRETMVQSGTWDRSVVIVSSDHFWRDSALYRKGYDPTIPFLVRTPGDSTGISVNAEFQTAHTGELVFAVFNGEINDNATCAAWIQSRSVSR